MRQFDKYVMFLAEQYETADAEVEGDMGLDTPEIKLDMDDQVGKLSEEERIEKFEQLEDILKELVEDDEEREELIQKIAVAADLEEEAMPEGEETHEGETNAEGSEKDLDIDDAAVKPKKKKKAFGGKGFPAFGSETDEATAEK